ncbi:MAG: protein-L-isoaspartate(D-aspartate) O-methyltransferase [Victivallaceae bacterium]|jgi:protein-L-isoaspartate(D-aspartate) O-methyltransferase
MVSSQIEMRGVTNPAVLAAMRKVERNKLVPDDLQPVAYADSPLPIGHGQTISQPYIVAYMTELLSPDPAKRILEIGTGSGYQAAVLAEIVQDVYTIEIIPALAERAKANLEAMGYRNIHFRVGDGGLGWPEEAPFDGIIVTAAAGVIPEQLLEQLKPGARMVIPLGDSGSVQSLNVVVREGGGFKIKETIGVRFVPLTGVTQQ